MKQPKFVQFGWSPDRQLYALDIEGTIYQRSYRNTRSVWVALSDVREPAG